MLVIISPAKSLDFKSTLATKEHSQPRLLEQSEYLISLLRKLSEKQIAKLMTLSEKLSALNYERYQNFTTPFTPSNARQALLAFDGDVYSEIHEDGYSKKDFDFAQDHLRILSGLYGVLRPLDLIQPYRLEMSIPLKNKAGKSLYSFWGKQIAQLLNEDAKNSKSTALINLASNEYFKAVDQKALSLEIITPVFKEKRGETFKTIALLAKKARGMMADFIIKNKIKKPEQLKAFNTGGYLYSEKLSKGNEWVFVRG